MSVQPDSFEFRGVDMLKDYGIRMIGYDLLLPKLRPRKVTVPGRDGSYDYGARYYDERAIKLDCDSMRGLSRQELREAAALLTGKGRLVLWDEPDKYYIGRVYNPTELKYIGRAGHSFTLTFACDPFAYGEIVDKPMPERLEYRGSAMTPTRIEIRNTGNTVLRGVQIRIRERSRG